MSNEDYRHPLAIDALAIALYNSVTVYHHQENYGWTSLTKDEQARYRQLATHQLIALTPAPVDDSPYFRLAVQGARDAAKVIGAITPETPYGESR